ncbi:MAG: urea ABC transporter substrate-binding protein [bacterium]|nr:urea ABC transporter substrate-binding protein [bacterium]
MTIEQLLTDIGLTDKEAQMYITLLRHGSQSTSLLAKKSGFNRGTAYVILHQLLEKGLAAKSMKRKVQCFAPLDPNSLIDYLDRQKKHAEAGKEKVATMMGQLTAITNPMTSKPKIEFFDGPEGARAVLERTLQAECKTIKAFQSISDILQFVGAEYFDDYTMKSTKLGYALHAIRTKEQDKKAFSIDERMEHITTSVKEKREIRFAPEDLAFPMTMFLFDDKLALISSKEESFAAIIQSSELISMQSKLFDLLWRSLDQGKIKVGILHSLTGTMAISERSLVDAELLAIEEINKAGGVLGKQLEPIVKDSESDPEIFARKAEQLVVEDGVVSVFGGWTSAGRKMMRPVFEEHKNLLWYPVEYEGLEQSPNIIYTGAAPNLHIVPAVDWAMKHIGKRVFLVGSDYVYPRTANAIMKERVAEREGTVVGEEYIALGGDDFAKAVRAIVKEKPDVIFNTINGDSNIAFFTQLRKAGVVSSKIPTISFSIGEGEINRIAPELVTGDYTSCNYFQSLDTPENKSFVERFQKRYGKHSVTSDPVEAAYNSVHLFAKAVEKAGVEDSEAIAKAAGGIVFDAPEGPVKIDPDNHHVHRTHRIGQINADGQFKIVWNSDTPIQPDPYPKYKSREEWHAFLDALQKKWGGKWER